MPFDRMLLFKVIPYFNIFLMSISSTGALQFKILKTAKPTASDYFYEHFLIKN